MSLKSVRASTSDESSSSSSWSEPALVEVDSALGDVKECDEEEAKSEVEPEVE